MPVNHHCLPPAAFARLAAERRNARLRGVWEAPSQPGPQRDLWVLTAVHGLVAWWAADGRDVEARARRALRLQRLAVSDREDPFAAIIRCTTDPAKADKRTRSKWSRLMRYAVAYKPDSEAFDQFIRRKGGINACVARFGRCYGRGTRLQRRLATG